MRAVCSYERDGRLSPKLPVPGGAGAVFLTRLAVALVAISASLCAQDGGSGIPYSAVFNETTSITDSPFRGQFWSADPQLKVGDDELRVSRVSLGAHAGLRTPFHYRTAPTDAMFRFWRLYANFPRTYFELIATDNANLTENNREGGVIAMLASDFDLLIQVTDYFQVTAGGRFIYLPFEGEIGMEGSGFLDGDAGLSGNVNMGNDLFVEARFDGTLGKWDAFVTDRIGLEGNPNLYSNGTADARLSYLARNDFDKADVLGRYRLGGSGRGSDDGSRSSSDSDGRDRWTYSVDGYYNRFSAGLSRSIPTDTRVGLTVYRNDYWGQDARDDSEDSRWDQGFNLSLVNQHYNMRFKPYFSYTVSESSESDYLSHVARLGVAGPLSEYTELNANVGYWWHSSAGHGNATTSDGGSSDRSVLWYISLHNELNELTTQRLSYSRYVQPDEDQLRTTLTYDLRHTLGPYLESSLFASWTETDDGNDRDDNYDQTIYEAGARLGWDVSSRLTLTLTGTVRAVRDQNAAYDYDQYAVRLAADYGITDTLSLWLSYEYTRRDDRTPLESYYENLVRMRLTKSW